MKKTTTALAAAGYLAVLSGCQMMPFSLTKPDASITASETVKDVTAITEVFGDGQKITAAVLHYHTPIDNGSLATEDFSVAGRTVTKVYANDAPVTAPEAKNGKYVVVELSPRDEDALAFGIEGRDIIRRRPELRVVQTGDITDTSGHTIIPDGKERESKEAANLIVDDFKQAQFADPLTNTSISYNLFVPKNYDARKSYPLVVFVHDTFSAGNDAKNTLKQGLGAVIWASPQAQAKHEAFVLAPQFSRKAMENQAAGKESEALINLIKHLETQYSIDTSRRYATGQAAGGTMQMAAQAKHPDFFAASYLISPQWEAAKTMPVKSKMWIAVSESDANAYKNTQAATAAWEKHGAKVVRKILNGSATPSELNTEISAMRSQNANIYYTVLQKSPTTAGQEDGVPANRANTWHTAYAIEGIRDWLFEQRKPQAAKVK